MPEVPGTPPQPQQPAEPKSAVPKPAVPQAPRFSITQPNAGVGGVRQWFQQIPRRATLATTMALGLGGVATDSVPTMKSESEHNTATYVQSIDKQLEEQRRRMQDIGRATQAFNREKDSALAPDVTLQPHQERVLDRTQEEDPKLLVYHGLGSGKSLSAIAAAEAARQNYGHNYGVVVPASLRGNFQKELKKFAPDSNPEIMSYTGLALGKNFSQQPDTLIMDEAQRLRNPESAAARAARDAARKAKRVLLLSGTPVTNSPGDMASLLSMLQERDISPKDFEKRYIGYKSKFPGIIPWLRGAQWGEVPYIRHEHELRKMLSGKIDYQPSKLPEGVDVQEKQIHVPLSKAQQKIQKALRTQVPPGFLWIKSFR
jgi:superfamily II DNA or RNA helicase